MRSSTRALLPRRSSTDWKAVVTSVDVVGVDQLDGGDVGQLLAGVAEHPAGLGGDEPVAAVGLEHDDGLVGHLVERAPPAALVPPLVDVVARVGRPSRRRARLVGELGVVSRDRRRVGAGGARRRPRRPRRRAGGGPGPLPGRTASAARPRRGRGEVDRRAVGPGGEDVGRRAPASAPPRSRSSVAAAASAGSTRWGSRSRCIVSASQSSSGSSQVAASSGSSITTTSSIVSSSAARRSSSGSSHASACWRLARRASRREVDVAEGGAGIGVGGRGDRGGRLPVVAPEQRPRGRRDHRGGRRRGRPRPAASQGPEAGAVGEREVGRGVVGDRAVAHLPTSSPSPNRDPDPVPHVFHRQLLGLPQALRPNKGYASHSPRQLRHCSWLLVAARPGRSSALGLRSADDRAWLSTQRLRVLTSSTPPKPGGRACPRSSSSTRRPVGPSSVG